MKDCLHEAEKMQDEEKYEGYILDCSVFDQAEGIALKKYSNGKYPDIFPWQ